MPDKPTITPATGVPQVDDDFDEDTPPPVDLPIAPTHPHQKSRAQTVPGISLTREPREAPSRTSARKALEEIGKLGKKLEEHTASDNENLQAINTTLLELTKAVGKAETAIATVSGEVSNVTTALEIRGEQEERIREDERMRARAQVELELTQKQHALKEGAASKAFRRKLFLRALSWLAPIFTAIGGAVAIAVHRGCGH